MSAKNSLHGVHAIPPLDVEAVSRVMTLHKATFSKLVENGHGPDNFAEFFRGIASTYARLSLALRGEVSK